MANLCSTEYKIIGPKGELDKIDAVLQCITKKGEYGLSDLVKALNGDPSKICCRGEITDFMYWGDEITIWQGTAWREQSDVRHFLEQCFPGISIYYWDEEPGCDWFASNDVNKVVWDWEYILDDSASGTEYFNSLEEIAEYINKTYNPKKRAEPNEDSIWDVMEQVKQSGDGELYILHQFYREND